MYTRWVVVLSLLSVPTMGLPAFADARTPFLTQHRCAIVASLAEIHRRGPRNTSRDRFITVALESEPQSYVQCIFVESDRTMFCEASSGAYGPRPANDLPPKLADGTVAALTALGFALENPNENFQREIDLGSPPDLDAVADLMLSALHDAYGATPDSHLAINAPKARDAYRACQPAAALKRRRLRSFT